MNEGVEWLIWQYLSRLCIAAQKYERDGEHIEMTAVLESFNHEPSMAFRLATETVEIPDLSWIDDKENFVLSFPRRFLPALLKACQEQGDKETSGVEYTGKEI